MQEIRDALLDKARALLASEKVTRVLAWEKGETAFDPSPAFLTPETLDTLQCDDFCGANLAKYLIDQNGREGRTLIVTKPCDTFALNLLLTEHRISREKFYALQIPCAGKLDVRKLDAMGITGVTDVKVSPDTVLVTTLYGETHESARADLTLSKCKACKGSANFTPDEEIPHPNPTDRPPYDRFAEVERLEALSPEERFAFFRAELSKCIRCNACRNVCPACTCIKCVFDNPNSGVAAKANDSTFEENQFHIIRAFHVSGRCTDCGECSRVCPQGIPLHLLNRKFIKDIDDLYGEFQSGMDEGSRNPLVNFTLEDAEPTDALSEGGKK